MIDHFVQALRHRRLISRAQFDDLLGFGSIAVPIVFAGLIALVVRWKDSSE